MAHRYRLTLEYNGAAFSGYQQQARVTTVESELKRVLPMVLRSPITELRAAGRTDAGVHARGQVASFLSDEPVDLYRLMLGVSTVLESKLSIVKAEEVPLAFNPRYDAKLKQYCYRVLNRKVPPVLDYGQVWHVSAPLNVERLKSDASDFLGVHDFTSFRASGCAGKTPLRTISRIEVVARGEYIQFEVEGKSFLKHMVRNMVGTLVARARPENCLPPIPEILAAKDRKKAGPRAPAHGLTLEWIRYEP